MSAPHKIPVSTLVVIHTPGLQDVQDFQDIARHVRELVADIEVFVASNDIPSSVTRRRAGRRPSLIFSPCQLFEFRPMRGKVYAGPGAAVSAVRRSTPPMLCTHRCSPHEHSAVETQRGSFRRDCRASPHPG